MRYDAEFNITGKQRGIGRIGGDYWLSPGTAAARAERRCRGAYPQSKWHNWDIGSWLLAPGPGGAGGHRPLRERPRGTCRSARPASSSRRRSPPTVPRARAGRRTGPRCQETLDARLLDLWTGTSTLQLGGGLSTMRPTRPTGADISSAVWRGPGWTGLVPRLRLASTQRKLALAAEVAERFQQHNMEVSADSLVRGDLTGRRTNR